MREYDNQHGVLFRVSEKDSVNHPDYHGNIVIKGYEYNVVGWIKTSEKGVKYLSISLDLASKREPQNHTHPQKSPRKEEISGPFF